MRVGRNEWVWLKLPQYFLCMLDAMKFELGVPVSHVLASESALVLSLGSAITSQLSTLVVSVLLFQFWVTHNRLPT